MSEARQLGWRWAGLRADEGDQQKDVLGYFTPEQPQGVRPPPPGSHRTNRVLSRPRTVWEGGPGLLLGEDREEDHCGYYKTGHIRCRSAQAENAPAAQQSDGNKVFTCQRSHDLGYLP